MLDQSYFTGIRGAVYFPARAYNAYQTYSLFDAAVIDRDFGYAQQAGINALRMFVSPEFWAEEPGLFMERFEQVIALSAKHGIRVMPVLFEDCGTDNTPETRNSRDPHTAICVCSPCRAVQADPSRWPEVYPFMDAFFARYKDDKRLLAIEVMNEPNFRSGNVPFAQHAVERARSYGGSVPLTIGCITLHHNLYFKGMLDIYQFHDNFPSSLDAFRWELDDARRVQEATGIPCWITEWQMLRVSGPGWDKATIPEEDKAPALHTLAEAVYGSGLGNFFWSLMVKPAYLMAQRPNGTFNGLFQEDGTVYSQADYRAVAHSESAPAETPTNAPWYLEDLKK